MLSRLPSWLVMKFSQGENTARAGGPPQGEGQPGLSGVNSPSLNAGRCLASGAERTLSIFRVAPRWCFRERGCGRPTPAVNPRVFLQAFTRKPATCAWQACALYPPQAHWASSRLCWAPAACSAGNGPPYPGALRALPFPPQPSSLVSTSCVLRVPALPRATPHPSSGVLRERGGSVLVAPSPAPRNSFLSPSLCGSKVHTPLLPQDE